jgi:hypothetical protein
VQDAEGTEGTNCRAAESNIDQKIDQRVRYAPEIASLFDSYRAVTQCSWLAICAILLSAAPLTCRNPALLG